MASLSSMLHRFITTGEWDLLDFERVGASGVTSVDLDLSAAAGPFIKLLCVWRTDRASTGDGVQMTFNDDTGANYTLSDARVREQNTKTEQPSEGNTNMALDNVSPAANSPASYFTLAELTFNVDSDVYTVMDVNTHVTLYGDEQERHVSQFVWTNTATPTKITFVPKFGTNFVQHSAFFAFDVDVP